MKFTLKKEDLFKYLIIIVIISTTLSFGVKYLGLKGILPWNIAYNDVGPWSYKAFQPGTPYIDKGVEYPVIIGMTMHLASLRQNIDFYLIFHYIVFLSCTLMTSIYLYKLANLMNTKKKNIFIFWALAPSLIWFSYYNWDIIAVAFSTAALYYYKEKRDNLATILLSLGFATKMYPILFFFPVLLHRKFREWIKLGVIFALTFLVVNFYFILNSFQTWYFIYGFHGTREPNIDSIWHLIMQLFPELTIPTVNILTLVIFASLYLYLMIKLRKKDYIFLSFIAVLLFLITNKVFSPQFTLWILPFLALYGMNLIPFYILEFSNMGVLFATLPHIFNGFPLTISGVFVVIRHLSLIHIVLDKLGIYKRN